MSQRHDYRIVVAGRLGEISSYALAPYEVEASNGHSVIHAPELDQAALFGLLAQVQALALQLVEVRRVSG
jgi:hypothetical protein